MNSKLMGLVLIASGIFVMGFGVNPILQTRDSASWSSTRGQIINSQLVTPRDTTAGLGFKATVEYQYDVEGRQFTGDRISFSDAYSSNEEYHQEIVDKYFPGKRVEVFYNPSNPLESVLEKRFARQSFLWIFIGIVVFGLGLAALF